MSTAFLGLRFRRALGASRVRSRLTMIILEELEPRIVPSSLTWTTLGEGSVTDNVVTMGVVGRAETDTQPLAFHGAYAQLPASKHYEIAFKYDLSTWDSYNASGGSGTGYWDSFSVSITSTPYPQLNILTDPLQFPFVWGGQSWTDHVLETNTGEKVITADFNVATTRYVNVVLDTSTLPTADQAYPSWGTITVYAGDLVMVKSDGTDVPDKDQESPGGYVPLNDDNDSYTFDAGGNAKQDKDVTGPIVTENDLVPIVLKPMVPASAKGTYSLKNSSSNLKIWTNKQKSGAVTDATTFDATQTTTLYVEGVGKSAGKAKEQIDLKWTNGNVTAVMDTIKYTVYAVSGPTNVPDYSIYTYKADVPGGGTPKWTADSGTVKSGGTTTTATILWGAGPVVGFANFSPAAGWTMKLDVNVVQVQIDAANSSLTYNNPPVQDGTTALIRSTAAAANPAVTASIRVLKLVGPTVNGGKRGARFMQLGMIQNGIFTAKHSDYDGLTPPKRRTSSLEDGITHLDFVTSPMSTSPWYNSNSPAGLIDSTSDADQTNVDLKVSDRPSILATDMPKIGGVQANIYAIVFDFNLYFAVRTKQAVNGSETVYTQRASSNWQFDGTGTVNAGGVWTQTGKGNSGSAKLTEVQTGVVVPVTTGTPINTLFNTETWTTSNKP